MSLTFKDERDGAKSGIVWGDSDLDDDESIMSVGDELEEVLERLRENSGDVTELNLSLLVDTLDRAQMSALTHALRHNTCVECLDFDGSIPQNDVDMVLSLETVLTRCVGGIATKTWLFRYIKRNQVLMHSVLTRSTHKKCC